ncbi:hypothetical protein [Sporosarcina sp. FSL W7-1283]|uniref:hypothetical protein n=1 Tax=Sporosarcina sp. FSL W7-1283 TaxID=2921560 RepID=UPI0030F9DF86
MKIDKARERIKDLQDYVDAYEGYEPGNVKQHAVKLYAETTNVQTVATSLNELGYRREGKLVAGKQAQVKIISNDVTEMLNGKAEEGDQLHLFVQKILNQNRKRKGIVI